MLPQGSLVTAILPILTCTREFLRMHINLLLYINRNFRFTLHRNLPVQLKSYNTKISLRLHQFHGESGEFSRKKQQKSQYLRQESVFSYYLGGLWINARSATHLLTIMSGLPICPSTNQSTRGRSVRETDCPCRSTSEDQDYTGSLSYFSQIYSDEDYHR